MAWQKRTKTIKDLIKELQSFEDQDLIVVVTDDEGRSFHPVQLVSKGFVPNGDDPMKDDEIYCALHI